jgi:hypothetical protein
MRAHSPGAISVSLAQGSGCAARAAIKLVKQIKAAAVSIHQRIGIPSFKWPFRQPMSDWTH